MEDHDGVGTGSRLGEGVAAVIALLVKAYRRLSWKRFRKLDPKKRRKLIAVRGKGGQTFYRTMYVNKPADQEPKA
jgi:hypothetical protein